MPHAFLWQNGVMTDLGVLPGDEDSGAAAINNLGQIVGSSGRTDPDTYEVTSRSFLYQGGVMTALPVPSSESYAGDINDSGVVVGTMRAGGGVGNYHAYIYADGVVTNLNSLIPVRLRPPPHLRHGHQQRRPDRGRGLRLADVATTRSC